MAFIGLLLAFATTAEAGLFSFLRLPSPSLARLEESLERGSMLAAARNVDLKVAQGGADIIIDNFALLPAVAPDGSPVGTSSAGGNKIVTHVVKPGESLSTIAKLYGVTVGTVYWSNQLKSGTTIHPGQHLVILPVDGVRHEVRKGDTIDKIATKYKADAGEILSFNNLREGVGLKVGTTVVVPDGEADLPKSTGSFVRNWGGKRLPGYFKHPLPSGRKTQGLHGRGAIDVAAAVGTPIRVAASGKVIIAREFGYNGGYGTYAVVDHPNGTQTVYAHMSNLYVRPGEWLIQGEYVGEVGSSGNSTGPHLHFEIRGAANPF